MMCAMGRVGRIAGAALGALLLVGTASACGGSSGDSSDGGRPSPSAASSTSAPAAYPSVPGGVSLTAPGTSLQLGQSATVAWKPTQDVVGALDVSVQAMSSTTFQQSFKGWELDDATKANAPYFVTATVRNVGTTDLGGRPVPLYGAAASGALIEPSTFAADFKPCSPGVLPAPFPAGATADVCLVYLVPGGGALQGVSFRPTQTFKPITWTGTVTPLSKGKKHRKHAGGSSSPAASAQGGPAASPSS